MPPVTALRSPPLSRMTGALSPVIALSFTEATPSTTVAVGGDEVARLDQHELSLAQRGGGHHLVPRAAVGSRAGAWPAGRAARFRSDAAWALPRPSAIASAKLAKSTVNQSQTDTQKMNHAGASPRPTSAWIHRSVVRIDPT